MEETDAAFSGGISESEIGLLRPDSSRSYRDFSRQIEKELPFLRRTVRRWHYEKADADDLVQDTLVQALANAHLWQAGSDLRAWLFTIMRNRFFAGRAKSNRLASALQNFAPAEPGRSPYVEARLILRDVAAVLDRLPKNQRSAVFLVGVEGQSYQEVAKRMGTSAGAVRCDLARARSRLRAAVHTVDEQTPCARRPAPKPASPAVPEFFHRLPRALVMAGAD